MAVEINGDGLITVDGTTSTQGRVRLKEDADNGSNYVELTAPASVTANRTITFPDESGTVMTNTGSTTMTDLTVTNDATINGVRVGRGAGAVSTNTAVGYQAINATASGDSNNAFGYQALNAVTSGAQNTALGRAALILNTTGSHNIAVGGSTLYGNTTGSYNTAVGREALQSNTTASNNTAVGYQAGYSNTTGTANVILGTAAGYTATTANYNTLIGRSAGYSLTTGSANTFVGGYDASNGGAGALVTTGSKNTILGVYNGNQGGLDIRTKSTNLVLSDGDGNPRITEYNVGDVSTSTVDIAPSSVSPGCLHFVTGFNTANGAQGWWLIATRTNSVTTISSSNNTGLTVTFGQTSSVRLNAVTSSGTINMCCFTLT